MNCGVVVFPGSNCDHDVYHVLKHVLQQDVRWLWHADTDLGGCELIVVPGGFSYGDYLRAGALASLSPVMGAIREHAEKGGLVEGTGQLSTGTGGRPAELFSFRREVLRERLTPGVSLPRLPRS